MEATQVEAKIEAAAMAIGLTGDEDQYLAFKLNGEEYGVDILRIQEIKGWDRITHIPNTPAYMLGVINLRGSIVPVVDLRQRFDMPATQFGPTTVVIVLKVKGDDRERIMGIVVDAVSDVYDIPESTLKPAPANMAGSIMESVRSLATVDEKMVILLDVDHLLNTDELSEMDGVTG
ncbi:Positive regulator of CheA protein activity (CheW) [hydrothermal vent metagenome]|uniref:Chemotaxis protein CheW n=1 Tax=hydrothermal vent metagenome TaxID=652676 RepID=A0A3B0YYA3_9ZZZZ